MCNLGPKVGISATAPTTDGESVDQWGPPEARVKNSVQKRQNLVGLVPVTVGMVPSIVGMVPSMVGVVPSRPSTTGLVPCMAEVEDGRAPRREGEFERWWLEVGCGRLEAEGPLRT